MVQSKKVYVAGTVMFAFIDRAHPKHESAAAFFRYFAQEGYQIYTDILCVNDVYLQMYQEISPSLAKDFLRTLALSNINVLYPEESDTKVALKALIGFQSQELTYQKALMAVLANKRGITQICTFDYLHSLFGQTTFYLPI